MWLDKRTVFHDIMMACVEENGIIPVFKSTLGSDGLCCSEGTQTSEEIKKRILGGFPPPQFACSL